MKIESKVDEKSFEVLYKKGSGLNEAVLWWQDIPLVGRLVQHGTSTSSFFFFAIGGG